MARRRYDKTRADRFLKHLRDGAPFSLAAQGAGLRVEDVRHWAHRRPEFSEELLAARSHQALATSLVVARSARSDPIMAEKLNARLAQEVELDRLRSLTADAA